MKHKTKYQIFFTSRFCCLGESTWNKENLFTGWADCPLSEKGVEEATAGGKLLKEGGFDFDVAYTSTLKRAIKTLWIVLEEMDLMYIPIVSLDMYCVSCILIMLCGQATNYHLV